MPAAAKEAFGAARVRRLEALVSSLLSDVSAARPTAAEAAARLDGLTR
jgi:hypothetical protein